ncbi:MAG: hypothetical protein ACOZCO_05675 [Bacteroidota bacterium]
MLPENWNTEDENDNRKKEIRAGWILFAATVVLTVSLWLITGGHFVFFFLIFPFAAGGRLLFKIFGDKKRDL